MQKRSSKVPSGRDPLKEFVWPVFRNRYRWFRSPHEEWAVSSCVDEETENQQSFSHEPLKDEPGLFRSFSELAPRREAILKFVNRHGLLGGGFTEQWLVTGSEPQVESRVELLRDWAMEILFMREMVHLWDSVQNRDERAITKRIRWVRRSAVFESSRNAARLRLPRQLETPWSVDLDVEHGTLRIRGWVVHPDRDDVETIQYFRSELIETALYFLEVIVNRKLADYETERPVLQYRGYERLGWHYLPVSLIGALWLQFADAIATNRIFNQCLICKRWFEVASDVARRDKVYCSPTCRTKAYRTRRIEALRLHALGATFDELAERFHTDVATIQRWIES